MTEDDREDKRALPLVVFTVLLIIGVTAASFALLDGEDTVDDADAVLLEPVGHVQEDDFFGDLDRAMAEDSEHPLTEITERVSTLDSLTDGTATTAASLSGLQVTGTEPGLYAGNRREGVCDLEELSNLLADTEDPENAAKAGAWANVLGLESADDIPEYLDGLTAVRLRVDTRVTNHTFNNGEATPFHSVLQAGTGVLVDDTGVPRVKCNCGNPLSEPAPLEGDVPESHALDIDRMAANPDLAWDRLDPELVATVTPGDEPLETLLIANIDTEDLLERPKGTNGGRDIGSGDLEATLRWESSADLDLSVADPNGASISAESPNPENSRGELDQDSNRQCQENMNGSETITWPDGDAPPGEYTVTVSGHAVGSPYEADCGGDSAEYTLTIKTFGEDDIVHSGNIADGKSDDYPVTLE